MIRTILLFSLILSFQGQAHNNSKSIFRSKEKKYYLSACAVFRDEARFLKEWIEFHLLVGVEHFYLLNNLSKDSYQKVLEPYINKNIVELYQWDFETTDPGRWSPIQTSAYQKIIEKSANETEWLALIDTDEFLFPVKEKNLKKFLRRYEEFGAVCVNWQLFGTSGVERIPKNALMIEMLTLRASKTYGENLHVKSIVRPCCVKCCFSPHCCAFHSGYFQVNEDRVRFEGPVSPYVAVEKIRINHYWSRDEDFLYHIKIPRRNKWGEGTDGVLRRNETLNQESDFDIFRYTKQLRKRMFK